MGGFAVLGLTSILVVTGCGSDDGSDDGSKSGALSAPVVEGVMAMSPGLHVTWKNVTTDCDEIEGERKSATEPFAVVFKVPGYVDNEHDSTPQAGVEHTYRLRCRRGSEHSAYSNEASGTP